MEWLESPNSCGINRFSFVSVHFLEVNPILSVLWTYKERNSHLGDFKKTNLESPDSEMVVPDEENASKLKKLAIREMLLEFYSNQTA